MEESSYLITLMLEFLYSGSYTTSFYEEFGPNKIGPPNTHLQLNILADKYDIPSLRLYAARRLADWVEIHTQFSGLLDCIPAVYQMVPPEASILRRRLLRLMQTRGMEIPETSEPSQMHDSESIEDGREKQRLMELVHEIPELLEDILEAFFGAEGKSRRGCNPSVEAVVYGSDDSWIGSEVVEASSEDSDGGQTASQRAYAATAAASRRLNRSKRWNCE
ncbi:MAG: hypothetical protein Q9174_006456 [Haloplaca sp. 1 TL-2023]